MDSRQLREGELKTLEEAIKHLDIALGSSQINIVRKAREALTPLADAFAARRMNQHIQEALSGHQLSDWE